MPYLDKFGVSIMKYAGAVALFFRERREGTRARLRTAQAEEEPSAAAERPLTASAASVA